MLGRRWSWADTRALRGFRASARVSDLEGDGAAVAMPHSWPPPAAPGCRSQKGSIGGRHDLTPFPATKPVGWMDRARGDPLTRALSSHRNADRLAAGWRFDGA